jgi:hypothetical protein
MSLKPMPGSWSAARAREARLQEQVTEALRLANDYAEAGNGQIAAKLIEFAADVQMKRDRLSPLGAERLGHAAQASASFACKPRRFARSPKRPEMCLRGRCSCSPPKVVSGSRRRSKEIPRDHRPVCLEAYRASCRGPRASATRAAITVGRYTHAHQFKRVRREDKFLRTARAGDPRAGGADGVETRRIHVKKGGHSYPRKFRVWISGQVRRVTAAIRREMRRRAAVEPVIGHLKSEHRMDRVTRRRGTGLFGCP